MRTLRKRREFLATDGECISPDGAGAVHDDAWTASDFFFTGFSSGTVASGCVSSTSELYDARAEPQMRVMHRSLETEPSVKRLYGRP